MNLDDRIKAFHKLGDIVFDFLKENTNSKYLDLFNVACIDSFNNNGFFDKRNILYSLENIYSNLNDKSILSFLESYDYRFENKTQNIGVINAGNIPFVEFYDIFYILISGFNVDIKLSAKNLFLPKLILDILILIEPRFKSKISYSDNLPENIDGVVASGSDLSFNLFNKKYQNIPNIIRGNKTSISFLNGEETFSDLSSLFIDMFSYYGLGCRNVNKIYVPFNYSFENIINKIDGRDILENKFYKDNYIYNKSLLVMLGIEFIDCDSFLLVNSKELFSPVSVINYEYYINKKDTLQGVEFSKIQCVVGFDDLKFGYSQCTDFFDYPDGLDVMKFLIDNF